MKSGPETIQQFFSPGGILSQSLPYYEYRHQQLEMALEVYSTLQKQGNLLLEAGTGVGKTLGYLMPLVLYAIENSKKVFIATGTKTLQNQLIEKELPFLKRYLPISFSYALCLGSENYLCERRLRGISTNQAALFGDIEEVHEIKKWAKTSPNGIRSELEQEVSNESWSLVSRISELCAGQECPVGGDCFYQKARKKMMMADILIGNHHLLFANQKSGWEYLPKGNILLVDEAHHLDQVASDTLGIELSQRMLQRVWEGLRGKEGEGSLFSSLLEIPLEVRQALLEQVRKTEQNYLQALRWFQQCIPAGNQRVCLSHEKVSEGIHVFEESLSDLFSSLKQVSGLIENPEKKLECLGHAQRLEMVLFDIKKVMAFTPEDPWLLWCEEYRPYNRQSPTSPHSCIFHASPIDPGELLKTDLYPAFESTILVSATMAVNRTFAFIQERLGLEDSTQLILPSPFDFEKNLLVYSPTHVPNPKEFDTYLNEVCNILIDLVQIKKGGMFVLCSSYAILNNLYRIFCSSIPTISFQQSRSKRGKMTGLLTLRQGDAPRERILELFRQTGNAVLFGAATFWQGVDVPGQALEVVVIPRLPFQPPDDPILEEKINRCRKKGGNPFRDIQLPYAIMQFRQGVGRLIRSHRDRGVVAVLDSRIRSMDYGKSFLSAIPKCPMTTELSAVEEFLNQYP